MAVPSRQKTSWTGPFSSIQRTCPSGKARVRPTPPPGGALDHHVFAALRNYTPINAATLQARITALYNEQCDALIQLRKHQLAGLEFIF